MRHDWPLCGRSHELARILAYLADESQTRVILVVGEPGIGKSRLAREAVAAASRRGYATRWIAANESTKEIPLAALSPFVRHSLQPPSAPLLGVADQVVPATPLGTRTLLVVDDADLLDDASAAVVRQLLSRPRLFLLVTVREARKIPSAIGSMSRSADVRTLRLTSLSPSAVADLARELLGQPLARGARVRMARWSGGNPLLVRHLVLAGLENHQLRLVGKEWDWFGAPAVTDDVVGAVERGLGVISDDESEVLDLLALCEPLDLVILDALAERSHVESLEDSGLVVVEGEGGLSVRLAHPLYGEVRRSRLRRLRARRLRGRLAVALAGHADQTPALTLRRALLSMDSGLAPDHELLTSAARVATALVDLDSGERLCRASIAAGGGAEPRLLLSHLRGLQGDFASSELLLAEMSELSATTEQLASLYTTRTANLVWLGHDLEGAEALALHAEENLSGPSGRGAVLAMRAMTEAVLGRWAAAVEAGTTAVAVPGLDPLGVVAAAFGLTIAHGALGNLTELDRVTRQAYGAASSMPTAGLLTFGLTHLHIVGLQRMGAVATVDDLAGERYDAASLLPGRTTAFGLGVVGLAALVRGRVETARAALGTVLHQLPPDERSGFRFLCLLHLTQAHALAGDTAAASSALRSMMDAHHPAFGFLAPEVELAKAWVAACGGDRRAAIARCHDAVVEAERRGMPAAELRARYQAVAFGDTSGVDALRRLLPVVDGPLAAIAVEHARALAQPDGRALLSVARELEAAGDDLGAANAAAQAALAFRSKGLDGSSSSAAARALALQARCEGASTPSLRAMAAPLRLTPRQSEVVTLVAQGLSNRTIADHLAVSVRTVEGHVYRVTTQFGLHSREDLRRLLELPAAEPAHIA